MDNLTPKQALQEAEDMQGKSIEELPDHYFNPVTNPLAISIIQQKDGNWKSYGQKNGKLIEIREGKPEDALGRLLTHE